jgi:C-terminal processing protease CtpA/Prc
MFKVMLVVSTILHLALIIPTLKEKEQAEEKEKVQKGGNPETKTGRSEFKIKKFQDKATTKCEDFYIGVGITVGVFRQIMEIAEGAPADVAGLQVGDIIITEILELELTIGQEITIDFYRDGMLKSTKATVAKICRGEIK